MMTIKHVLAQKGVRRWRPHVAAGTPEEVGGEGELPAGAAGPSCRKRASREGKPPGGVTSACDHPKQTWRGCRGGPHRVCVSHYVFAFKSKRRRRDTPASEAHGAHPNSCDCRHVLRVTCEGSSTYSLRSVQRTHSPVVSARGPSKGMQGSGQRRVMVGAGRFELPTPCSRSKCATRLRYAPPDRQSFEGQRRSIRSRLAAARAAL